MDDYECPKCTREAITLKYHERWRLKPPPVWVMEYRCPRGHKWNRVMSPNQAKPKKAKEDEPNQGKPNGTT